MTTMNTNEHIKQQKDYLSTAKDIVTTHTHETRAVGHANCDACLNADANAVASIVAAQNAAATRMRDKCVAKVKAVRDEWRDKHANASELGAWRYFGTLFNGADEIITALESLTLDQVEQKEAK